MIKSPKVLIIILAIPIIALFALVIYKKHILSVGKEVTLPIRGYDPRDLLSGHYLIYSIEYGVNDICLGTRKVKKTAYVCLEPKQFSFMRPEYCQLYIEGECKYGRFTAGIERYYIPQEKAKRLEDLVRSKKASIVLSVMRNGKAQIKDLLIDGQPWQSYK